MLSLLKQNRKGAQNILSTLIIFSLMTVSVAAITVQIAPMLGVLEKGANTSVESVLFYDVAEAVDQLFMSEPGAQNNLRIQNQNNWLYQIDTGHQLQISISGTATPQTITQTWGLLNATYFVNDQSHPGALRIIRGGSGATIGTIVVSPHGSSEGETTLVVQQQGDAKVHFSVIPRVLVTARENTGGTILVDLLIMRFTFRDNGAGQPVGFPQDSNSFMLNMTYASRTVSTQSLGILQTTLTVSHTFDGVAMNDIIFPGLTTGATVQLRTIEAVVEISTF